MADVVREKLDSLLETLGKEDTVAILLFALPLIAERQDALRQFLQASDWGSASHVAHKTLSSLRIYATNQVEVLLQQVRQQDIAVISTAEFQAALDSEFSMVIQTLQGWLSEHSR